MNGNECDTTKADNGCRRHRFNIGWGWGSHFFRCRYGGIGTAVFFAGENHGRHGPPIKSPHHDYCETLTMNRIYISRDRGAGAWAAAAWDRWGKDEPPPVDEVVKWGQVRGFSWSQPGALCPVMRDSNETWYVCGYPGDPDILIRVWSHLLPLVQGNRLRWRFEKASMSAPSIGSWEEFRRGYDCLVRAREKG